MKAYFSTINALLPLAEVVYYPVTIQVDPHTDYWGSSEDNWDVSEKDHMMIIKYLPKLECHIEPPNR